MIPNISLIDSNSIEQDFYKFKWKYIFIEWYYFWGYLYDKIDWVLKVEIDEWTHKFITKIMNKNHVQNWNIRVLARVIIRLSVRKKIWDIKKVYLLDSCKRIVDSLSVSDSEISKVLKQLLCEK